MRIIIELDNNNTQPEIQMGAQSSGNITNLGATAASGKAIDAGAPKVGTAQLQSSTQEMSSSTGYEQQPQTDTGSAGSAPGNVGG